MLKPKTQEEILSEIVSVVNVFDCKYLKSDKQAQWCDRVISTHDKWQQLKRELIAARTIEIATTDDLEWRSIVDLEVSDLKSKTVNLQQHLDLLLVGIYPYRHRNIFLEISTITGGEEASIWVQDLVRMYTRYAERKHFWRVELVSEFNNYPYGFHQSILEIKGAFAGCFFQFENGIHQLRRKSFIGLKSPEIHTSIARVSVLPIIDLYEIEIDLHNLELQHFTPGDLGKVGNLNRGIGARLVYTPIGTRVACAVYDRHHKNKEKALEIMASKLYDLEIQAQLGEDVRSGIVRTYDYQSNCVTDRSSEKIHALDRVVNGELDALITSRAPDCPIIIS